MNNGRPSRRIGVLLLAAVLVTPLLGMPRAHACSCMQSDPRDDLHAADGAFVGTYVGREPTDPADPYAEWDYIFDTETVFKGNVEDVVRVRAPANGAGCGLEYQEGATAGLFLRREAGGWRSSLCMTVHPDRLEEASRPFPVPDAEGPPRLVVGGSFGEVRVIALDAQGRTAGYGYGDGDALLMAGCPGGETSTELVRMDAARERIFVDVRTLADLSVARTLQGPARWNEESILPRASRCVSQDGDTVVFVSGYGGDGAFSEIVRFERDGVTTIHKSNLSSAALGRTVAYGSQGRTVVEIDYGGGGPRTVVTMSERVSHLALSPNGRLLAGLSGAGSPNDDIKTRIFVVDVRDGTMSAERVLGGYPPVALEWVNARLVLASRYPSSFVVSRDLEKKTKVSGWFAVSSVALGCRLFGAGYGAFARTSACTSENTDVVRTFFSPITNALLELPSGTEMNAPPRG